MCSQQISEQKEREMGKTPDDKREILSGEIGVCSPKTFDMYVTTGILFSIDKNREKSL